MEEIWKEIKGFDGKYSVSNYGRIRQNNFIHYANNGQIYKYEEKIIKPFTWQSRYLRVDLQHTRKIRLSTYVHKLVAEYFIGPRPTGYQIDHIDGNYLNNEATNLRYVTVKENMNNPITKERLKDKILSEETKLKISNKLKGHKYPIERNKKVSQALTGRIRVTKDNMLTKLIKPEELEYYLNNGWIKGGLKKIK